MRLAPRSIWHIAVVVLVRENTSPNHRASWAPSSALRLLRSRASSTTSALGPAVIRWIVSSATLPRFSVCRAVDSPTKAMTSGTTARTVWRASAREWLKPSA